MSEVPARPPASKLLVVDLEATCWERRVHRAEDMETIEIGALLVELAAPDAPTREFQAFVRPRERPELSAFCRELTGIRQADVDAAPGFERVFPQFVEWIGGLEGVRFASWGRYDRRQLETDCARHGLVYPFGDDHLNLKHWWPPSADPSRADWRKQLSNQVLCSPASTTAGSTTHATSGAWCAPPRGARWTSSATRSRERAARSMVSGRAGANPASLKPSAPTSRLARRPSRPLPASPSGVRASHRLSIPRLESPR